MIRECPHCHMKVLPEKGNLCPSCSKNLNDTSEINLTMTSIEIKERYKMPEICFKCGSITDNHIKINKKSGDSNLLFNVFMILLIVILLPVGLMFYLIRRSNQKNINIELPICNNCLNDVENNIEPEYADYNNYKLTFTVHKNFKEKLIEINKGNI